MASRDELKTCIVAKWPAGEDIIYSTGTLNRQIFWSLVQVNADVMTKSQKFMKTCRAVAGGDAMRCSARVWEVCDGGLCSAGFTWLC